MGEKENKEWGSFLSRYDTVLSFLSLELLCLGSFALGGSAGLTIFRMLGFFLSLICVGYVKAVMKEGEWKRYWLCLLPFLALALLTGISRFFIGYYSSAFAGIVSDLTVSFGLIGFFLLGQSVKNIPVLKRDVILLVVGASLALMVIVPGIYSLIRYGFFYASRFKGMVYYYDGVVFRVDTETKVLNGFSFAEASLRYGKAPAFLLSLFLLGCFYVSPKKEWKRFLAFLGFGLLGLLDLIFVPYVEALIFVVFIYVLAGVYFLIRHHIDATGSQKKADKVMKILYWVFVGLVLLGVLLLFIDAFTGAILGNFPIARIRNNRNSSSGMLYRLATSIRSVFVEETSSGKSLNVLGMLFGVSFSSADSNQLTRVFEINFLWQNGLLAFALLLFYILYFVRECHFFLLKDKERMDGKIVVVAILFGALVCFSLFDDESPLHHQTDFLPFSRNSILLLTSFLSGLVYSHKAKEVSHE